MPLSYFVVDAFTDRPFSGNPAAVMPLTHWPNDDWLQQVAMEMNLSETAFLVPRSGGYDLRWFTPKVEVDLCGHATLASAKVLSQLGQLSDGSQVSFTTRSGVLRAHRYGDRFELDFPLKPAEVTAPPDGLLESLRVNPDYVGRNQFDFLLEVGDPSTVRGLAPDFKRLANVACRGVIVTSVSDDSRFDFISRFFAPAAGIDEDPVTGSAHCCLGDHWMRRLNKRQLVGYQASPRGGIVHVEVRGERVCLGGEAVVMSRGEWLAMPSGPS